MKNKWILAEKSSFFKNMFLEKSKNIYNQFCKVLQYAEK